MRQFIALSLSATAILAVAAVSLQAQFGRSADHATDPGVRTGPPSAGSPLPGLTPGELIFFNEGKEAFEEEAVVRNPPPDGDAGLGPGFNSDSCVSCHSFPATGGTSPAVNPQIAVTTAMGARNRIPWFLKPDGPALEARFKYNRNGTRDGGVHNLFSIAGRSDAQGCLLAQEDFSNRNNISLRIPTPAFGMGLIEAIPESVLIANLAADSRAKALLGISGKMNVNGNDGTTTRFGWKGQNKSIAIFAGEAYTVEMGVTNALFPQERNETPGCMFNVTPEDDVDFITEAFDDVPLFASFMRFLAAPERGPIDDSVRRGAEQFASVGCAYCHTPRFKTGTSPVAALSEKLIEPYSDFAVHGMGPGLADDIEQGAASGDEFRTAPLWGVGQRIFFLHDGRTTDLMEAIQEHASDRRPGFSFGRRSEADGVINRFNRLSTSQQQDILNFLRSL